MEMSKTIQVFETAEPVSDVEVNWVAGGITLRRSEGGVIRAVQKAARELPERCRMEAVLSGSRLILSDGEKSRRRKNVSRRERTFLELYLPETALNGLSIHSVSNWIVGNEVNVCELNLSMVSGDVRLEGEMKRIEANLVSGDLELSFHTPPQLVKVNSVSGQGILRLPEDSGFTIEGRPMAGTVDCDYPLSFGRYGDGNCRISLSGISGRYSIKKYFGTNGPIRL